MSRAGRKIALIEQMFLLVDKAILLLVESHVKGVLLGSVSQ